MSDAADSGAGTGIEVARTVDNQLEANVPGDFSSDVGRADIRPDMRPVLDQLAPGLDPAMRLRIVGRTGSTGSDAINEPLSVQRASSVREYLAGRGARVPAADNASAAGRAMNRRVEIFLREPQA